MDPATLIPTPEAIPLAAGWLRWLLLATFLLHLLAMNLMLGGSMIALVNSLKGPATPPAIPPLDQELSRKLPYTVAFTVNLGVPPFLFLQLLYGQFIYTSSVIMASWWIWLFLVVMAAYYAAYAYDFKFASLGRARVLVIGLAVACLLWAGFLLVNNMTLMLNPPAWTVHLDNPGGGHLNLAEPSLAPRYLHFVVASLAVAGLGLALWGRWLARRGEDRGQELVRQGLKWFMAATLVQLAGGLWFLFSLPAPLMGLFIGGDLGHTTDLWGGVAAALLALVFAKAQRPLAAACTLLPALALMVLTRDALRQAYLQPYFNIASLPVEPQYGAALMFAICLGLALPVLAWLLKIAAQARRES
jgi:hypothetical protein